MTNFVEYYNYGRYSSDNYGVNSLCFIDAANNEFYFSYKTLVAFRYGSEFHIIKNQWGTTTGKHLNWINPDKTIREDEETFTKNYNRLVNGIMEA